jgi:very-short-patch-repair endonuclease
MACVLAAGVGAVLSHESAAALWGIRAHPAGAPRVSVPANRNPRNAGFHIHRRRTLLESHLTTHDNIPTTDPVLTLIDLATRLGKDSLEAAINEADKQGLLSAETLRATLLDLPPIPGSARLRATLDAETFTLTDSELERRFLRLVGRAGLPRPLTQQFLNGHRVDFYWPELGLVVETDGLTYHRTPQQQAKDLVRDQAHTAAGMLALRFTHPQVRYEEAATAATLRACIQQAPALSPRRGRS